MADHIRFAVSCDVVDEYTTTNTAAGDITLDIANTTTNYSRIHPAIKRSLGGNGKIDTTMSNINGGWSTGTNTPITSNGGSMPTVNSNTDIVFIKHTGQLFDDSGASAAADTVLVKIGSGHSSNSADVVLAELANGEAIVLPRPGLNAAITLASGSSHVKVEVCVVQA